MKHIEKLTRKRLGEVLLDEGLITQNQLLDAESEQAQTGRPLGMVLVEASYLDEVDLAKTVALNYQLPYLQLHTVPSNKEVRGLFSPQEIVARHIVPLDRMGNVITLAVSEMPPFDYLEDLRRRTNLLPFLFVAMLSDITRTIESQILVGTGKTAEDFLAELSPEPKFPGNSAAAAEEAIAALERVLSDEEDAVPSLSPDIPDFTGFSDSEPGGWQKIFDTGNESVMRGMSED